MPETIFFGYVVAKVSFCMVTVAAFGWVPFPRRFVLLPLVDHLGDGGMQREGLQRRAFQGKEATRSLGNHASWAFLALALSVGLAGTFAAAQVQLQPVQVTPDHETLLHETQSFIDLANEIAAGPFHPSVVPHIRLRTEDDGLDPVDVLYQLCEAADLSLNGYFVDANEDGLADTILQYGASIANEVRSVDAARKALILMRHQARLRAMVGAESTVTLLALAQLDDAGMSVSLPECLLFDCLGPEWNEVLRGPVVTGMRLVALPGVGSRLTDGICLIVRLEASLESPGPLRLPISFAAGENAVRISDWKRARGLEDPASAPR